MEVKELPSVNDVHRGEASQNIETQNENLEKRTMRRVDLRILPLLALLYSFALIDRTNLGLARVAGMGADLNLSKGHRYSIVSCVYSVAHTLVQLPGSIILRRVGARPLLTFCVVSWGIVMLSMGFVSDWKHLVLCRVLLGTFEAPFSLGVVFLVTTWYTRYEVQQRLAAFSVMSILAGGFNPILAYGLSSLHGRGGLAGWSWIFVLEGAITISLGLLSWLLLPGFPDQCTFLTAEQTDLVLKRIENDRGDSLPDTIGFIKVLNHFKDWTIWLHGLMYMCAAVASHGIAYFLPIILSRMGWSKKQSLLLSAPPYVLATFNVMVFAWLSDRFRLRAPFIAIQTFITLAGLVTTAYSPSQSWRYVGVFLITSGSSGSIPGIIAFSSNNIVTHSKRAAQAALMMSFASIGTIFATTIFRERDFPRYIPGMWAAIACQLLLLALLLLTTVHYWLLNNLVRLGTASTATEGKPSFLYTI